MLISVVIVMVLGVLAGVLVNVLADDLPRRRWPTRPHYPDDSPRPFIAWSGITAVLTGNRRAPSGAKLPWRHLLVEIVVPLLMVMVLLITANDPEVSSLQRAFYYVYMALFVLITVIDIEHRLILFVVIIPSCLLAIADAVLTPMRQTPDLRTALMGGALGFGVFFVLYLGGILFSYVIAKIRGYDLPEVAFGYGDVMLATLCGLILGWQPLIVAMFITVFLGALGALIYLIVRSMLGRYDMFTPLPYGPYIVLGSLIILLYGEQVRLLIWSIV
jgi:prepilin signal peptidase PulO-like enzyme (type II secretory pathway)